MFINPSSKPEEVTKGMPTFITEHAVVKYLFSVMSFIGEAIALYLIYALGLRVSEACTVTFGDIKPFANHPGCFYLEVHSNNSSPQSAFSGKSSNVTHLIPLHPAVLATLFWIRDLRIKMLTASAKEVECLTIAFREGDLRSRCCVDDVKEAGKKMCCALGISWVIENTDYHLQQDCANDVEEPADNTYEILGAEIAYTLRCMFSSSMERLGLLECEIAYIMGRMGSEESIARDDFWEEQVLYGIKQKMDKRTFPYEPSALSYPTDL